MVELGSGIKTGLYYRDYGRKQQQVNRCDAEDQVNKMYTNDTSLNKGMIMIKEKIKHTYEVMKQICLIE